MTFRITWEIQKLLAASKYKLATHFWAQKFNSLITTAVLYLKSFLQSKHQIPTSLHYQQQYLQKHRVKLYKFIASTERIYLANQSRR